MENIPFSDLMTINFSVATWRFENLGSAGY